MSEIKYILNGSECNPTNRKEINYVLDFSARRFRELEISVDTLRFVGEDYDFIKVWRGTFGDYVGIPLEIDYGTQVIKYMLDLSDPATVFSTRSCSVKLLRYRSTDNFFDRAEGQSFRLLNWQPGDFRDIDYVIIPDNQFSYLISLSLATFALAQELANAIQEIAEGIADLTKAIVPVGIPPGPDWGAIIVAAIKLAARIAYAIFIIIALIKLLTEILNLLFPKIRQFKGVGLKKLIEKGVEYEGYTLQSTMLDQLENAVILPVPLRAKDPSLWKEIFAPLSLAYTEGFPSVRDTIQTLGQALNFLERDLNAQVRVLPGDIVRIEQESYFEQQASQTMSEYFNDQEGLSDDITINSDEIFKRLVILYQVDPSDINTFDDSKKTLFEASSEVLSSPDPSYETIKKLQTVTLPFARGTRKGSLTFLEKAAKVLATAVDLFCGTSLAAKVEARKDVLQLSQQYFGTTKLLWMNGTKLHPDQNAYIGADVLAANFWESKYIENNQKNRKRGMPLELTRDEFFSFITNNYVTLNNGGTAKVLRVSWSDQTNMSEVDYERKKAAVNEKTTVINAG